MKRCCRKDWIVTPSFVLLQQDQVQADSDLLEKPLQQYNNYERRRAIEDRLHALLLISFTSCLMDVLLVLSCVILYRVKSWLLLSFYSNISYSCPPSGSWTLRLRQLSVTFLRH